MFANYMVAADRRKSRIAPSPDLCLAELSAVSCHGGVLVSVGTDAVPERPHQFKARCGHSIRLLDRHAFVRPAGLPLASARMLPNEEGTRDVDALHQE